MASRSKRVCLIPDCASVGQDQPIVKVETSGGKEDRVIAEWMPCGHFVAPPLPPTPRRVRAPQYSAMDQIRDKW